MRVLGIKPRSKQGNTKECVGVSEEKRDESESPNLASAIAPHKSSPTPISKANKRNLPPSTNNQGKPITFFSFWYTPLVYPVPTQP